MMVRWIPEWFGKDDNSRVPDRVRTRIFDKYATVENGKQITRCPLCTRVLEKYKWDLDHIIPLISGGLNREANLWPICRSPCHSQKTVKDVAEKARNARKRRKHLGIKRLRRTIGGKRFDGSPIKPRLAR